jgi:hypothetical protein
MLKVSLEAIKRRELLYGILKGLGSFTPRL